MPSPGRRRREPKKRGVIAAPVGCWSYNLVMPSTESPRMAWVKAHVTELTAIAEKFGATRMCLCGSVARGTDTDDSDIDFYVWEFEAGEPGSLESIEALQRADNLVSSIRDLSLYRIDVRGIPGWPLGAPHEDNMRRESIDLARLVD
jgi:predicted nucleotidyltransferase